MDSCDYINASFISPDVSVMGNTQTLFPFPAPLIDPIPTQRLPEYVRDILYGGEESKLKVEFSVRYPNMVMFSFTRECLYLLMYR